LAQLIRNDRIDILVDLTGHMGGHRLTMFARKPARVQLTHFNYPDTTGMSAMDYRFSDGLAEPPGMSEKYSTETLVRLAHCAWCCHPGFEVPEVKRLPALDNGYITFGSLNKPIKHSLPTITLWAKILRAVPNSWLLLLGTDAEPANPALAAPFAAHGIGQDRLLFMAKRPRFHTSTCTIWPTSPSTPSLTTAGSRAAMRCGWACAGGIGGKYLPLPARLNAANKRGSTGTGGENARAVRRDRSKSSSRYTPAREPPRGIAGPHGTKPDGCRTEIYKEPRNGLSADVDSVV
jgi:hypothetical protein